MKSKSLNSLQSDEPPKIQSVSFENVSSLAESKNTSFRNIHSALIQQSAGHRTTDLRVRQGRLCSEEAKEAVIKLSKLLLTANR